MQTTKQTTGLRTAAKDYQTIVQQASGKLAGFEQLHKDLQRALNVSGKSTSTLTNYGRYLAHLALHYHQLPTEPDSEQVLDYLHFVKANGFPSATFLSLLCMACAMPVSCVDCLICNLVFPPLTAIRNCRLYLMLRK